MKGIIIWAFSYCRSVMALYRELGKQFNVPILITLYSSPKTGEKSDRELLGFRNDEFDDLNIIPLGKNYKLALDIIESHPSWHHLFCTYQKQKLYRNLMQYIHSRGDFYAILSESPCNSFIGIKKHMKDFYISKVLPLKIKKVIRHADFFVNWSGNSSTAANRIGWPENKIIPFGYFPPPLEHSHCLLRTSSQPFHILSTGIMSQRRGADILVNALIKLKQMGVAYRATITQSGELFSYLQTVIKKYDLPVELPGFLPLEDLIRLYETCTVFVASGRAEPWGMRLNDALNCGAPLIISTGMGGTQLVDLYHCGFTFLNGDSSDLAEKLKILATQENLYRKIAQNSFSAAKKCSPNYKAHELFLKITSKFKNWN